MGKKTHPTQKGAREEAKAEKEPGREMSAGENNLVRPSHRAPPPPCPRPGGKAGLSHVRKAPFPGHSVIPAATGLETIPRGRAGNIGWVA